MVYLVKYQVSVLRFQVCKEWEREAKKVNKDVRLALIRIGVVLGKEGGALGNSFSYKMSRHMKGNISQGLLEVRTHVSAISILSSSHLFRS